MNKAVSNILDQLGEENLAIYATFSNVYIHCIKIKILKGSESNGMQSLPPVLERKTSKLNTDFSIQRR